MGIPINWEPTTASLHDVHKHLTSPQGGWPQPQIDVPPITAEQRRRAQHQWTQRVRATYVSTGQASTILQQLIALGAPLEVLTGAAYTAEEMTLQLTINLHLLRPLDPPTSLSAPESLAPGGSHRPSWEDLFTQLLEFFAFNLTLSRPVYRALYAVSSDRAISELSGLLADNLGELTTFGELTLQWLHSTHLPNLTPSTAEKIPRLFASYESLFHGSPKMLDSLAGQEVTVQTRPGNLGTLSSRQLAAIFYDTLQSDIFPLLQKLGIDAGSDWRRRHRFRHPSAPRPFAATAVGLFFPDDDRRARSTESDPGIS